MNDVIITVVCLVPYVEGFICKLPITYEVYLHC